MKGSMKGKAKWFQEAHEEESAVEEQDQADSDNFDEDDQDNYM